MKRFSDRLTEKLIKEGIIAEELADFYSYGFERICIPALMYLIIIITAFITNTLVPSIIFTVSFVLQRQFCGGYHCSSAQKCTVVSLVIYSVIPILTFVNSRTLMNILPVLSVPAAILIFLTTPAVDPNNPQSDSELRHFKLLSRTITVIVLIFETILFVMKSSIICLSLSYSMIVTSLLLIVSFMKGRKNEENSVKGSC